MSCENEPLQPIASSDIEQTSSSLNLESRVAIAASVLAEIKQKDPGGEYHIRAMRGLVELLDKSPDALAALKKLYLAAN